MLTYDEIDNLEAGVELNKHIALNVMGWSMYHYDKDYADACYYTLLDSDGDTAVWKANYRDTEYKTEAEAWAACPDFSGDMAAAWKVVERLRDLWTKATEGVQGWDNSFAAPFDDEAFFDMLHRHADRRWPWAMLYMTPEAICKAALACLAE